MARGKAAKNQLEIWYALASRLKEVLLFEEQSDAGALRGLSDRARNLFYCQAMRTHAALKYCTLLEGYCMYF